ncbi:Lupeol synthase [Stylosanthes scabra]|uniref:Lupeol synthase n=1 Tax=Stylosanthes scabra TaxID=79078 RepID=A0ABU6YSM4_9FABA|nr:Lupeol synthase [Stylosanthes scabra]
MSGRGEEGLADDDYEDPNSKTYQFHLARIPDYFWVAEDGLKIVRIACNFSEEYGPMLKKAHEFLKASQVCEDPPGDFKAMHRHISKGAWTFNIQDQGLQVFDCTAEGLKVS